MRRSVCGKSERFVALYTGHRAPGTVDNREPQSRFHRVHWVGVATTLLPFSPFHLLKAPVAQPFQHRFGFKVTILMMKRAEAQRVHFAPSERQLK